MKRLTRLLLLLPLLAAATGCENGAPWANGDAESRGQPVLDLGPTAAFERLFVFLGPGDRIPTAAVFDFSALSDSVGVRRGVRGRLADGDAWVPLLDVGWEMGVMHEPWRIVPHGPLKLMVADGGELSAVAFRGEPSVRLEPGALLAEATPDAGTQLLLRQAALVMDGEVVNGILLDAQLARTVPASAPLRRADRGAGSGEDPGGEPGREIDPAESPDEGGADAAVLATPTARPGAEALLVDNSGYYLVLAPSPNGDVAWISEGGRDEVQRGVSLEPIAWTDYLEGNAQVPTAWRIVAPDDGLTGEIQVEAATLTPLTGFHDLSALGYVLVTGWIEDGTPRRSVYGLVRHVQ